MVAVVTNEIINDKNMEKENEKTIINESINSTNDNEVENKENLQNNNEELIEKDEANKNVDKMDVDEDIDNEATHVEQETKNEMEQDNIPKTEQDKTNNISNIEQENNNKVQENNETSEIVHNKEESTNIEQENDKESIGLTSDEEDKTIENRNEKLEEKVVERENNNPIDKTINMTTNNNTEKVNEPDHNDAKIEDHKNVDTNNNVIETQSTTIENINTEVSNQINTSKNNEDIPQNRTTSTQNVSNVHETEQQKRHMPRSESSVCSLIVKTLERHPNSIPFLKPVDPVALNIPDYFNVIKHPMDFSTILKKIKKGEYPTMSEFVDDVDLVFKNCMTYNPPNNPVHKMGQEMKDYFIEQLKKYPDHFSEILLNKFEIDLSTMENSERRPRRQVRPPQHFEPEDELLMKRIKQQQKRSLMEQNEAKTVAPKSEEMKVEMETYEEPVKVSKASTSKATKVRKNSKKAAKATSKSTTKKRTKKRSYRDIEDEEEMDENMEDLSDSSSDSEDELVEQQITALTACLQQAQQQLELLQAQSNILRHSRKKSRRSISSFSEYYSNSEKETPISSKALAAAHRRISSTSNVLPNPPTTSTRGRKKQNTIRKTAITNSALQSTGTRKRSKTKSETNSPAKRSPANSQGKVCEYCGGSETPMWRRGPSGKGSLCNKCGVKWKSGKIYKGEPIPSQSGSNANSLASSAVSTPNINPPKSKRQKVDAPPKKPKVQSITYAQKKELSEMIGNLDEDNLNGVIDIIKSGIPDLKDGQEEIELDIETIDPVTLRKLYRYVKKVSKPVKVQKPINQELQNFSDYSSGGESSESGEESNE